MSSDSTVLVTQLGRFAKSVLPIVPIRNYLRSTTQRSTLNRALDDFVRDPWSALNADSDIPRRLIEGWGNPAWSTDDEYLITVIDELARTEGPVLECGSGLSTIVMGIICGRMGRQLWTLEHDAHWGEKVGKSLAGRGLGDVELCVNPLKDYGDFSWYDPPLERMAKDFGLVICDGPPGKGHGGRYGFLPVMRDRLAAHCTILVDDTIRDAEKAIAQRWSDDLDAPIEFCGRRNSFAAIRIGQSKSRRDSSTSLTNAAVTIGVPARDGVDAVSATIESMLDHNGVDWSLIVSDHGSRDATQTRCLEHAKTDPRIHYYRRDEAAGSAAHHSELARKCRSRYFRWQRAGESWDGDSLAACIAALDADPHAVLAVPRAWIEVATGGATQPLAATAFSVADPAQRFFSVLSRAQNANALYGLIRADALRDTALLQDFGGAELVLLAELALRGTFAPVPARAQVPARAPAVGARPGSMTSALLGAIWRSPASLKVKLACVRHVSANAGALRERAALFSGDST